MLDILLERAKSDQQHQVHSAVIQSGLSSLRKLRPIADIKVRPLIDAWVSFIQAWDYFEQGAGSAYSVETQRQSLLNEMTKE